jgi:hypothetical protein
MGYTHYFRQHRHASPEQWSAICKEFNKLLNAVAVSQTLPIQLESDDPRAPRVDSEVIAFNGIDGEGCETMMLRRCGSGFDFCKTRRERYDRFVVALLLIAHKHAPGVWSASSDGTRKEWREVVGWLSELGMGMYETPLGVN